MRFLCSLIVLSFLFTSCSERKTETQTALPPAADSADHWIEKVSVVFLRDTGIFLYDHGGSQKFILQGYDPGLSPDGSKLTFMKYDTGQKRQIYITSLDSVSGTLLNAPSTNFYGGQWSPDGNYIAFNIMPKGSKQWAIGLLKSDNTGLVIINGPKDNGLYEPTWAPDSKSIIAHSLQDVYEYDLSGKEMQRLNISETMGKEYSLSSDNRFWITKDKKGFFFSAGVDEGMAGVEGPVVAVMHCDLDKKKVERLSPKGIYASDLHVVDGHKLLFTGSAEHEAQSNVYAFDFETGKLDKIITNASSATSANVEP
jgi:Tol biopolymer transport system component